MTQVKVGSYGTVYKAGSYRYAVKVIEIKQSKCVGILLSFPDELCTFNSKYFIPRGEPGGMMALEGQIKRFEEIKNEYPNPKLNAQYDNYKNKSKGFG
ncbi:MAG: hypothetical protein AAFV71_22405 [Cyanobacteria bacterium J06633_8]